MRAGIAEPVGRRPHFRRGTRRDPLGPRVDVGRRHHRHPGRLGDLAQGRPAPSSVHVLHCSCVSIHKSRPGPGEPAADRGGSSSRHGFSPWRGLPPGRPHPALLRRDIRLRVLAVRVRAGPNPPADRTALLLHRARRVLGAVVGWRGRHRGQLRPARPPPAPRGAAVVRRGPHRRADHARRRDARLRRHGPAHMRPGRLVRRARPAPRPRAYRSQRRRGRLRGARPAAARPAPGHPGGLAASAGPARPRPAGLYLRYRREPLPAGPAGRAARGRLPLSCWLLATMTAIGIAVEFCPIYFGAELLTETGLRAAQAATAMSIFYLGILTGRVGGARLTRRAGRTVPLLWASLAATAAGFLFFWLAASPAPAIAGLFLCGLGIANLYPLSLALTLDAGPGHGDTANARVQLLGGVL